MGLNLIAAAWPFLGYPAGCSCLILAFPLHIHLSHPSRELTSSTENARPELPQ